MDYNIIVETLTGNRLHFNEHKPDMAKSICDERNEEQKGVENSHKKVRIITIKLTSSGMVSIHHLLNNL
jgi:hypothetical protein